MSSGPVSPKDYPLADPEFTIDVLNLIQQACSCKTLKIGANEARKSISKGISGFVVIAADADTLDMVLDIPPLAEEKYVPCVFVPSGATLGKACAINRPVLACCVTTLHGNLQKAEIQQLKDIIEKSKASYFKHLKSRAE